MAAITAGGRRCVAVELPKWSMAAPLHEASALQRESAEEEEGSTRAAGREGALRQWNIVTLCSAQGVERVAPARSDMRKATPQQSSSVPVIIRSKESVMMLGGGSAPL